MRKPLRSPFFWRAAGASLVVSLYALTATAQKADAQEAAAQEAAAQEAAAQEAAAQEAADGDLGIELNKVESTEEGCRTLFVFDNRTGHQLDRFRVDLILFDSKGVYKKQLLLDMAPLYADKKTVASFLLGEEQCGEIGSILVNDIPQCQNGSGSSLDCVGLLEVDSKSAIPLEK